jgi:transposase
LTTGRNAWLFAGSDDHAASAGHIFSLIASARLHKLDPEAYLRDLFRVLAHWPRDRYLELAPKCWAETRARLDEGELANEIGVLTVPPPIGASEQSASR